jgi:hypothetical protein
MTRIIRGDRSAKISEDQLRELEQAAQKAAPGAMLQIPVQVLLDLIGDLRRAREQKNR